MKAVLLFLLAAFAVTDGLPQELTAPRRRLGTLGAFIDDAETVEPGYLVYGISTSYRRGNHNEDFDFMGNDISYGLRPGFELTVSFPISNSRFEDLRVRALGDFYFGAKMVIVPAERGLGIAFAPMLEVLGKPSLVRNEFAPTKVNAVLPLILQHSFERFRLYGEAGYITRGTAFVSTGVDWTFAKRWGAAVIISGSRITQHEEVNRELNINLARCDAVVGLNYRINDRFVLFANGGRTISRMDQNSSLYQATLGLTITQKAH